MKSNFSIIVIGLMFIIIATNAYFKFSILKQYKYLRDKGIELDPKAIIKTKARKAYLEANPSPYGPELETFGKSLTNLLRFVLIGFCILLLLFLYFYVFGA